ncbi:hypothetical protein [Streptomyces flavofungini]|uniref:hypothetical protein n=1 Tax=Streptomyces flavofungini TaxID=68200 RepID=UPI0025B08953|nr:hypothetical protein [Streptomyces flavofungini]WJV51649.1 hypothetical protein QUY26_40010 [Streptomyces flavofungini]
MLTSITRRLRQLMQQIRTHHLQTRRLTRHHITAAEIPVLVDAAGHAPFAAHDVTHALRGIATTLREHPELSSADALNEIADQWDMGALTALNGRADGKNKDEV